MTAWRWCDTATFARIAAELSFRQGRRVNLQEIADGTGIHRTTLSKMINVRGYNASLSNVDSLCRFFGCQVGDVALYVPDEEVSPGVGADGLGKGEPSPSEAS